MIEVEVHLFNSLRRYAPDGGVMRLTVPAGTPAAKIAEGLGLPRQDIYVALHNGHNIMTGFGGRIEDDAKVQAGDRLAFSGPVPFSRGYGAPVC